MPPRALSVVFFARLTFDMQKHMQDANLRLRRDVELLTECRRLHQSQQRSATLLNDYHDSLARAALTFQWSLEVLRFVFRGLLRWNVLTGHIAAR